MLNEQGYVAECTGDNVFLIKDGAVFTPPISAGGLDGITRQAVIEILGKLGISCQEKMMTRHDVFTADECFLTGTAAEVIPAVQLDRRLIGTGKPGPITAQVVAAFHELVKHDGTPVPYTA
jgi:branched-chain amino acid aminotransferase